MSDRVMKVNYCYVVVPNRPGQGAKVFTAIRESGVNLLAHVGFPRRKGSAQLDFVAPNLTKVRGVARKNGWRVSKQKKAFLVQGSDKSGAVNRHFARLADARIGVPGRHHAADDFFADAAGPGASVFVAQERHRRGFARTVTFTFVLRLSRWARRPV